MIHYSQSPSDWLHGQHYPLPRAPCKLFAVLAMVVLPVLPMGTGSPRYARKWSKRLSRIKRPGDLWASLANVSELALTNREWIVWVAANSHSNPWGGTVVTKDTLGWVSCSWDNEPCADNIDSIEAALCLVKSQRDHRKREDRWPATYPA
jgi:hypothetical protein